jgi:uncharacterized protein (TIGR02145 family)
MNSGNYSIIKMSRPVMRNGLKFLLVICFLPGLGLLPGCEKEEKDITVRDIDGNVYNTVTIGTQVWMQENLRTTTLNDGTPIPMVTDPTTWGDLTTPAYCWYDDDEDAYKEEYGGLYNWYTVNTSELCPDGWHVPARAEWDTLISHLGGEDIAGGKLRETGIAHWKSPNEWATNQSGFAAFAGGAMVPGGVSRYMGTDAFYWSATEYDDRYAWIYRLSREPGITVYHPLKTAGSSVRCIKD